MVCRKSETVNPPVTTPPPPVVYAPPAPEHRVKISVTRIVLSDDQVAALANQPRFPADFGHRVLIEERADTLQPPPWTSRLTILDTPGGREAVVVEVRDHASYGVSHQWLNAKLVFLRVWWGRIVTTEVVLDVGSLQFNYAEDANYFGAVYPQTTTGQAQ